MKNCIYLFILHLQCLKIIQYSLKHNSKYTNYGYIHDYIWQYMLRLLTRTYSVSSWTSHLRYYFSQFPCKECNWCPDISRLVNILMQCSPAHFKMDIPVLLTAVYLTKFMSQHKFSSFDQNVVHFYTGLNILRFFKLLRLKFIPELV